MAQIPSPALRDTLHALAPGGCLYTNWCTLMAKAVISSTFSPSKATSDEGVGYFMGYDLSTFTTQNAKRTFWNACSERRGVFSGFMDPRSVRILFLLPAKRIHSSTWSFSRSFQAVQEQNLQALTCTILLKPGKKRIRLWPAERFLKALKKGSVFGLPSAF